MGAMQRSSLRRSPALVGFLLPIVLGACASPAHDGWVAFRDGDFAAAVGTWQPVAESGDSEAQYMLGLMHDEGRGIPKDAYEAAKIISVDPFVSLDQDGVGQLMKTAIAKGQSTRKDIKLGICGEHGGDPDSVKFCHRIGLAYVSCSPYRVPVARLAAAQAALENN